MFSYSRGCRDLWRAIPPEQKERFESLRDEMREQFAREEDMDAQVEAFLQEARQLAAQQRFHSKEVEYYTMLGQRDPSSVAAPPLKPGIEQTHPPGKERPGQFGHGYNTNWAARYSWITNELSSAIKRVIEGEFGNVRIKGEVGRVSRPRSGHIYLDLKDDKSVINGVIWKGASARLQQAGPPRTELH